MADVAMLDDDVAALEDASVASCLLAVNGRRDGGDNDSRWCDAGEGRYEGGARYKGGNGSGGGGIRKETLDVTLEEVSGGPTSAGNTLVLFLGGDPIGGRRPWGGTTGC
mmetsp:Transcript_3013/g.4397  ORF Transcript_3013/g.4397 Transcript_3013/m.4397 type:complete len:109 (-) Transcript_3013:110-436(-)